MEASHLLDQAQLALQAAEGSASHSGVAGSQRARVLRLQSAVLRLAGKRTEVSFHENKLSNSPTSCLTLLLYS